MAHVTYTTLLILDPKIMVAHSAETAGICDRLAKVQDAHITTMSSLQPIMISHGQAINAGIAMTCDFE